MSQKLWLIGIWILFYFNLNFSRRIFGLLMLMRWIVTLTLFGIYETKKAIRSRLHWKMNVIENAVIDSRWKNFHFGSDLWFNNKSIQSVLMSISSVGRAEKSIGSMEGTKKQQSEKGKESKSCEKSPHKAQFAYDTRRIRNAHETFSTHLHNIIFFFCIW